MKDTIVNLTELCPKCGKPTSKKETTEGEMLEDLQSTNLKISPLCNACTPKKEEKP